MIDLYGTKTSLIFNNSYYPIHVIENLYLCKHGKRSRLFCPRLL